jgi:hypothetical protein
MIRPFPLVVLTVSLSALAVRAGEAEVRWPDRPAAIEAGDVRIRVDVAQRGPARPPGPFRQWRLPDRRGSAQEPASARGYADGYTRGLDDGRGRRRYDPVDSGSYRSGDSGYYRDYGPRDAYRNNYRAGFRQGYEDGYRAATRRGR